MTHDSPFAYDPWFDLARRPGVDLRWHNGTFETENHKDPRGLVDFASLSLTLRVGMTEAELRSTVAHEIVHLDEGPVTADKTARNEAKVELTAAKRLINPRAFDEFVERFPKPSEAQMQRVLRVDRSIFCSYASWRRKVTATTARRAWSTTRAHIETGPAWPPAWPQKYDDMFAEAARFATTTGPTR